MISVRMSAIGRRGAMLKFARMLGHVIATCAIRLCMLAVDHRHIYIIDHTVDGMDTNSIYGIV